MNEKIYLGRRDTRQYVLENTRQNLENVKIRNHLSQDDSQTLQKITKEKGKKN